MYSRKENETKIHEHLYNNIFYLKSSYPTTNKFDEVFRKDMFVKNNKAAFHEVVYYLLNTLNPELIKKRITSWPIYEVRMEQKFRSEVHRYLIELNTIYKNANLPVLMASQLIAPGGYKFTRFMMKLSQLVLVEHLQKNEQIAEELTYPNLLSSNNAAKASNIVNDLKLKTEHIERGTKEKYDKFMEYYQSVKEQANNIELEISQLNKELGQLKLEREVKQKKLEQVPSCGSMDYEELVKELEINMQCMENFTDTYKSCSGLMSHILDDNLKLNHEEFHIKIPTNSSILCKNGNLDLIEALEYLNATLQNLSLKLPNFDTFQLQNLLEKLELITKKYSKMNAKFEEHQSRLLEALNKLQINANNLSANTEEKKVTDSEETLAVPLTYLNDNINQEFV